MTLFHGKQPPVNYKTVWYLQWKKVSVIQCRLLSSLMVMDYLKYINVLPWMVFKVQQVAEVSFFCPRSNSELGIISISPQPLSTVTVPYANSFNPDETLNNSASHLDPSCLTHRQHFTKFERLWGTLKIEADEKFSRRQLFWRAKNEGAVGINWLNYLKILS